MERMNIQTCIDIWMFLKMQHSQWRTTSDR